jgi:hypothetical protein
MGSGDWAAVASVLAVVVAVLALQTARQSALATRQQAAVMAQQAGGEEGGQPWLDIVGARWRRDRLEVKIRQLSGPPLAEIYTFTRLAGVTAADDGEPAVWRDSALGAANTLAVFSIMPPRRACNLIVEFFCAEYDGPRTWHITRAVVVRRPLFV